MEDPSRRKRQKGTLAESLYVDYVGPGSSVPFTKQSWLNAPRGQELLMHSLPEMAPSPHAAQARVREMLPGSASSSSEAWLEDGMEIVLNLVPFGWELNLVGILTAPRWKVGRDYKIQRTSALEP